MNRAIHPVEALRATRELLRDPMDTEKAFRVVRAIDGGAIESLYGRMIATEEGRRILRDQPSLLAALADGDALAAMPEGSLGRAYLDFCRAEGITPGGLVAASDAAWIDEVGPELRYLADRLRDAHDLWHVVAGYRTDLLGELCVLAFSWAQTRNAGLGLLVAAGYLRSFTLWHTFGSEGRALARAAYRRGRRAEWLPAVRWEELLPMPLEDVRRVLRLGPPPVYAEVRLDDVARAS